ncbi:MAG: protease SohB [Archangium sp.]
MDTLSELLGFAGKAFVIFITVAATTAVFFAIARRRRLGSGARLDVKPLHQRFEALGDALRNGVLDRNSLKSLRKERKQQGKDQQAKPSVKPNVYVLDFDGDILASSVISLRDEVSAIVAVAKPEDEVVVRLESPGGGVPHYGLAAAQLVRLKERKVKVTVCVDRVAASGGYMMACVADRIVAAPFSIVGSIGVVAQVPNFHRLLKKYDVDYQEMTAGEFKRTVSVFGEITEKGKEKFTEQLEETHTLFKDFVKSQRPSLDVAKVATGEYWLGTRAKELGLVDQLGTSDDYLMSRATAANVYQVKFTPEGSWRRRFGAIGGDMLERAVMLVLTRLRSLQLS